MTAWQGVLALTLVVRDEEDVLAANLDYHLAQGVDVILVIDHGSRDRTPEILSQYERGGSVVVSRDETPAHDQVQRVNHLLRLASEKFHADWIIHCDADEFWMPTAGKLRDVFAAIPDQYGYVRVPRSNFVPVADDERPFHQRMTIRERHSKNLRGHPLEPKVAQRPAAASGVLAGNHGLDSPVMKLAPDIGALQVLHFPMRGFEQFERKVVNTGTGYEQLAGRGEGIGIDQLELLAVQRRGELRGHYEAQALDDEAIDAGLRSGELVGDDRLQRFLSGSDRAPESAAVQQRLREGWLEALELERRIDELAAALEQAQDQTEAARREAAFLAERIATIQASRLMRYTASIRAVYYRVRPSSLGPRR